MTKVAKTADHTFTRWEWFVYTPIVLSIVAAFAVLFAQGVVWLKTSKWYWIKPPEVAVHFQIERLATGDWVTDKILAWFANDAPLFLWLILIFPLAWRILTAITESILPNR